MLQVLERFTEKTRSYSFQFRHDVSGRVSWQDIQKNRHMIGHHFHGDKYPIVFSAYFLGELFELNLYLID
ncbi:hypothetical protein SAMN02799630_03056 [Paenibacillus sp. UNCCL117]|nr:hypothetical protein SAMN04488602_115130 [Paenibacillus sp. cl123]SFW43245.1 hypothetical protein SAMN02799630_03056 [Paenibacillus sp. UNCCL117]